jgi:hypothetical protein
MRVARQPAVPIARVPNSPVASAPDWPASRILEELVALDPRARRSTCLPDACHARDFPGSNKAELPNMFVNMLMLELINCSNKSRTPRQCLPVGHGIFDKNNRFHEDRIDTKYCLVTLKSRKSVERLNKWFFTNKSALFWASIPVYCILGNSYVRARSGINKAQWLRQAALKRDVLLRNFPSVCWRSRAFSGNLVIFQIHLTIGCQASLRGGSVGKKRVGFRERGSNDLASPRVAPATASTAARFK